MNRRRGILLALVTILGLSTAHAQTVNYIYDDLGRLVGVVDQNGNAAQYTYDAVGNLLSIARFASSQVSIIQFSPSKGPAGTVVTISGTGFSSTAGQNAVSFNGVAAQVTSSTANQLVVIVPSGAGTGPISITSPLGSATSSAAFTVTNTGPQISSFTPTVVSSGTAVTVSGTNFDASAGNDRLSVNQTVGIFASSASMTQLTVAAPANTGSGHIGVATAGGSSVSTGDLYIVPSGYTPASVGYTGRTQSGSPVAISVPASNIGMLLIDGLAGQELSIQMSSNTLGTATVAVYSPQAAVVESASFSSSTYTLNGITISSGTYTILVRGTAAGSITITPTTQGSGSTFPPTRPAGSSIDLSSSLAANLAGLFLMNETTGSTTGDLVDSQSASFSGSSLPQWSVGPSINFTGGASLNSYINAGTDLTFDQLTTNQMTVVAKVYVSSLAAAGICEKNDNNATDSGFVFGWDSSGALKLTVEKSTADMRVAAGGATVTAGQWMQVAFTWDGTIGTGASAHLYVNGVELSKVTSSDGSGTLGYTHATNQPFRIGNASFDFAGSLNGKMAYLAVYKKRILSPAELIQLDQQLPIISGSVLTANLVPNGQAATLQTTTAGTSLKLGFSGVTNEQATIQFSGNTMGSVTATLVKPDGTSLASTSSSAAAFALGPATLPATGGYSITAVPSPTATGSLSGALQLTNGPLVVRPYGASIDSSNALATNLAGLFLLNEASGTTTNDLLDSQSATLSGSAVSWWVPSDPSIFFGGGASLNSYVNAGTDLTFDQLTTSKMTVVAKVYVNNVAAAGICEKNDNNSIDSGFVFGWDGSGALKLTVEKSSQNLRVAAAGGTISAGQWMQVAFTWDGTVGTAAASHLFVNGVEQTKASSQDGSGTIGYSHATGQPFRIGNAGFDFAGSLNGKMAYLAVYKGRILTTTEMNQLDTQLPIH